MTTIEKRIETRESMLKRKLTESEVKAIVKRDRDFTPTEPVTETATVSETATEPEVVKIAMKDPGVTMFMF
jgi:uncharacterized membrane-anchored protein